jgi:hypothetical protein
MEQMFWRSQLLVESKPRTVKNDMDTGRSRAGLGLGLGVGVGVWTNRKKENVLKTNYILLKMVTF